MDKKIVWGTCWLNESVENLVEFFKLSIRSLSRIGFDTVPIIFDANYTHNDKNINYIKKNINNVIIIQNKIDIFPNKNYGVALITNKAYELNIPYVSIVDSDWNIQKNYSFVRNIILTLMDYKYDILIPNIGMSAGRSNILIGKTVVNLFYPEYKDVLLTTFPGAVVAVTNKLYTIVNNKNYHYDWGGEWDIISLAIKNNMKINTSFVEVLPARHRPNDSKIKDSFQIWRAILSNEDIINRFDNLIKYDKKVKPYNKLSKLLLNKDNSINEMIDIIEKNSSSETEQQLLYMILYPIAYILGKIDDVSIIESSNKVLYDEAEINMISDLAIYCCRLTLISCDIAKVCDKSKKIKGKYFSSWSIETQNKAIKEYEVI